MRNNMLRLMVIGFALAASVKLPVVFAEGSSFSRGVNPTLVALAGSSPQGHMHARQGEGEPEFLKQLNLTPQQKAQLKALMKSHHQQGRAGEQELMAKRKQLMDMIKSGSGSKEQAISLSREIGQQHQAMMERRIGMIYDMKAILTPEQFQKFRSLMEQRRKEGRFGGGMHRFGRGGGPGGGGPEGGPGGEGPGGGPEF